MSQEKSNPNHVPPKYRNMPSMTHKEFNQLSREIRNSEFSNLDLEAIIHGLLVTIERVYADNLRTRNLLDQLLTIENGEDS